MGIIEKKQRSFTLVNPKKLLLYWASIRSLQNEIVYTTYHPQSIREIETMMPPCVFTAYTAYKHIYHSTPADYSDIYAYADPNKIQQRFPPNHSPLSNIYILKQDAYITKRSKKGIAPPPLIYVDLWNLNTWYATEFIKEFDNTLEL